jgi:hypothetical protein
MSQQLQKHQQSKNSLTQYNQPNSIVGDWIKSDDEYAIAITYTEKRIGDFTREDMTKLVELMAQWRLLLGVTSESSEHELIVIVQFMYDNFKKYTLADVRLAMNWAISGKTEVGFVTQKNISSFYVSKAMKAYDDEKRIIYNRLMAEREKHLSKMEDINKPKITPLQKAESFKEMIVGMYDSVETGGIFYDIGDMVYNWLKRTGQLKPSKEQIDAAVRYGQDRYYQEKEEKSLRQKLTDTIDPMDKENRKKKYAREFIIMQYFTVKTIGEIVDKIHPSQFEEEEK